MLVLMQIPPSDRKLVQIVDAALAQAAQRAGPWLACRIGCTQCCHGAFAINALDALRLQEAMIALRAADPSLAAELHRRARAWIEEHGSEFPGDLTTGQLGETEADRDRFEQFANEAPCPALDPATGRCDVYAARPMTCRVFGPPVRMGEGDALGHCELCFHGATEAEVEACEMPVPHDLEAELVKELGKTSETVVAFALLPSAHALPR
ncbi:MAG: YkgJ family cysteine cluster protein [Terracidiphilus sp.]|nr:YkgJ family cysteine cluster protein [Terracidiphilus sp.]